MIHIVAAPKLEERDAKLRSLQRTLRVSIEAGGVAIVERLDAALDAQAALLGTQGVRE